MARYGSLPYYVYIYLHSVLPWSESRSVAERGKVVCEVRLTLASLSWCTPHRRLGWWHLSWGSWWRTAHPSLYVPPAPPAQRSLLITVSVSVEIIKYLTIPNANKHSVTLCLLAHYTSRNRFFSMTYKFSCLSLCWVAVTFHYWGLPASCIQYRTKTKEWQK